ncbi:MULTISPECIES: nitrate reductase molybdenum cofactor assembly chaperone [Kocuria]|uniref:Nitrate reductase molybdenum cofactor assembly chaperone n=1 Tax=Kocuria salsicia TaxID=664639 RepID=A0ABV3KDJ5_9MICC|nr:MULTISPECIES: nitrate reductase molybdenum cofactor assembly chaperone [Kocuria]MBS6030793.1 nitrate reductase molybdenum cofactor assembly chaperone [Kocuria rhizophila]
MGLLANLLGKPGKGTVEVPGYRDRTPQRSAVVRQCAGLLLSYPSPELVAQLPLLESALEEVGVDPQRIAPLTAWLRGPDLREIQGEYVQEFDLSRRHSLHLTYWTDGDTRRRGEALSAFKQVYRSHGCEFGDEELPDHLPVVLEFAARVSAEDGFELLQRYRPSLELLRLALVRDELPQACAVELICSTLPGPSPEDESAVARMAGYGPPTEEVGLDAYDPRLLPMTGGNP